MYQIVIVEDDPMVASINRRYAENIQGFSVRAVYKNGREALEGLRNEPAELVILDYYTPEMNGDEFLDRLHEAGMYPEVIMVTSANSADIVQRLLRRGVTDYLVKPFEFERFKRALERFRAKRELLMQAGVGMEQAEIDRIFAAGSVARENAGATLPKGMNEKTLELIRGCLRENRGEPMTGEEIAGKVGLSRITVRRYVAYLTEKGELSSEIDYQTGGRPGILYQYRGNGGK